MHSLDDCKKAVTIDKELDNLRYQIKALEGYTKIKLYRKVQPFSGSYISYSPTYDEMGEFSAEAIVQVLYGMLDAKREELRKVLAHG